MIKLILWKIKNKNVEKYHDYKYHIKFDIIILYKGGDCFAEQNISEN